MYKKYNICKCVLFAFSFLAFLIFLPQICVASDQIGYRYYYQQLTDFQKQIYDFMLSAPHETATYTINIHEDLKAYSSEEIEGRLHDVFFACDMDNPEQTSWIQFSYQDSFNQETNQITITICKSDFYKEEDMQKISSILDEITAKADPAWDDYTKALYA